MNAQRDCIHKTVAASATKGADPGTHVFTLSTGTVDRDGDRIDPRGWDLSAYQVNPVVLWGHDARSLPIGKCTNIRVVGGKLKGTVTWPPPGCYPFADQVKGLVDAGFVRSASVGFRADASEPNAFGGHDIKAATLLEWSVVNIPSNPSAMLERGVNRMQLKHWLGKSWHEQPKEDDMDTELYLEVSDDFFSKAAEDDFDALLARLRQGYREMTGDKFIQLMAAQLIANPEAAAAVIRALESAGVYEPKHWDVDEREVAATIGKVIAEEVGKHTRAALCQALGRLD